MIVDKSFLNKLRDFGLNSYEAKIWTALLSRGVSTAGELSDIANVPRSRSYDVLESLEKKGFVIVKLGKPIKYIAVKPSVVLERVKEKVKKDAEERIKILEEIKQDNILEELNLLHESSSNFTKTEEIIGAFKGRDKIYNHLYMLMKNAKKSIIIKTTDEGVKRKIKKFKNILKKSKEKGVNVKILAPIQKTNDNSLNFIKIKKHPHNARFVVVDNEDVLLMLNNDKKIHPDYDVGIWFKSKLLGSFLTKNL